MSSISFYNVHLKRELLLRHREILQVVHRSKKKENKMNENTFDVTFGYYVTMTELRGDTDESSRVKHQDFVSKNTKFQSNLRHLNANMS